MSTISLVAQHINHVSDDLVRRALQELLGLMSSPTSALVLQDVRTESFTLKPTDSGSIIPVTGNVTVTADADSKLTAPVVVRRMNAGTLSGVASGGITLYDAKSQANWGTLQVTGKLQALLFDRGSSDTEYEVVKLSVPA